jgi:hypothetical protein
MAYSDLNIPADIACRAQRAMTPEASLVQLNTAIAKAETSQRYKIADREMQRGDLRWMYPERARLEAQVARRRRGGIRLSRVVPI